MQSGGDGCQSAVAALPWRLDDTGLPMGRTPPTRELDKIMGNLFDFDLYGETWPWRSSAEKLFQAARSRPDKNLFGAESIAEYHLPISYLGTFITEKSGLHKNEMNLKHRPSCTWSTACEEWPSATGLPSRQPWGRLDQLVEAGVISENDGELFRRSFQDLMMLNIRENLKEIKQGMAPRQLYRSLQPEKKGAGHAKGCPDRRVPAPEYDP